MQLKDSSLFIFSVIGILLYSSCRQKDKSQPVITLPIDSTIQIVTTDSPQLNHSKNDADTNKIYIRTTTPEELLTFARTLNGIPYKYASADPDSGFDCSGFITHVFNHFDITVPRSSLSFTNIDTEIPVTDALPGDLILFTGTDTTIRMVGHMGIIESIADSTVYFIHATSGKANSVTISLLSDYYKSRFIKVIRVF